MSEIPLYWARPNGLSMMHVLALRCDAQLKVLVGVLLPAAERRENNSKGFEDFQAKVKARIWRGLSYVPYSLDSGLQSTQFTKTTHPLQFSNFHSTCHVSKHRSIPGNQAERGVTWTDHGPGYGMGMRI